MLITYDSIQDPDSPESKSLVKFIRNILIRTIPCAKLLDADDAESIGLFTAYECISKRPFDLSKGQDKNYLIRAVKNRCVDRVRTERGREGKKKKELLITNMIDTKNPHSDLMYGDDAQYRRGEIFKPKRGGIFNELIEAEESKKWSGVSQGFWERVSEMDPETDPRIVQVMIHYLQKGSLLGDAAKKVGLKSSKFREVVRMAVGKGHLKHDFKVLRGGS